MTDLVSAPARAGEPAASPAVSPDVSPTVPAPAASTATATAPCVYYDGGCPVCRREIATYQRLRGGEGLLWVDAHAGAELGPGLGREAALRRLHVRLPDGRLVSGAAAFVAIWQRLPAFRPLALLARLPGALAVMEGAYRAFLWARPLWRRERPAAAGSVAEVAAPAPAAAALAPLDPAASPAVAALADAYAAWPAVLRRELRTDHAGEAGAVMIYRGVLAVARDPELRAFAEHHLATEAWHLALVEAIVPPSGRSRLLPLWRVAGWLTGALPACLGPRAVYATIESVETFVDRHYADQLALIDRLSPSAPPAAFASMSALRTLLAECQHDEQAHRDDARARRGAAPATGLRAAVGRGWSALVASGSAAAVRVSRWI